MLNYREILSRVVPLLVISTLVVACAPVEEPKKGGVAILPPEPAATATALCGDAPFIYRERKIEYETLGSDKSSIFFDYAFCDDKYLHAAEEYVTAILNKDPVIKEAYNLRNARDTDGFENKFIPVATRIIAQSFVQIPSRHSDLAESAMQETNPGKPRNFGRELITHQSQVSGSAKDLCLLKQLFANKIMWKNGIETYTLGGYFEYGSLARAVHHDNILRKKNGDLVFQDVYSPSSAQAYIITEEEYRKNMFLYSTAVNVWTWNEKGINQFAANPVQYDKSLFYVFLGKNYPPYIKDKGERELKNWVDKTIEKFGVN